MTKDEALRLALEALEDLGMKHYENTGEVLYKETFTAIKAALEAKDEPVACVIDGDLYFHHEIDWEDLAYQGHGIELLYTTPPQRTWIGLTADEMESLYQQATYMDDTDHIHMLMMAEAKIKDKNT